MLNVQAYGRTGIAAAKPTGCWTHGLTAGQELQSPDVHDAGLTGLQQDRNCNRQTSMMPDSRAYSRTGIAAAKPTGCWTHGLTAGQELQLPNPQDAGPTGLQQDRNCSCQTHRMLDSRAYSRTGIAAAKPTGCRTHGLPEVHQPGRPAAAPQPRRRPDPRDRTRLEPESRMKAHQDGAHGN